MGPEIGVNRQSTSVTPPLYARVLGASWHQLAEPLRCLHTARAIVGAHGDVRIECGRHPVARVVARMLRLPQPSAAADTRLVITARDESEHWARTFSARRLDTLQYACQDGLAERFGVLEFRFRLHVSDRSLLYVQSEAAFLFRSVRLPIPASWAPRVEAREDPAGTRQLRVDVRVVLPVAGPLISYAGIVELDETRP